MKLLIVTQAVDTEDPILGFFVRWVAEFAKHVESVQVICLREGKHELPAHVHVHSLGKERGTASRFTYSIRFIRLVWRLRHEYDVVFVHMNPEYIILAGVLWRFLNKRILFWYNHPSSGPRLSIAAHLAHKIFHTSPYAASARYAHAERMPAGIDTELFKPTHAERDRHALYLQGRVAPSKRIEVALEALRILRKRVSASLTIVGPEDASYVAKLTRNYQELIGQGAVKFMGPKRNDETPALYTAHGAALNLAAAGHFDKTVLEAMACETPVVVGSKGFSGLVPDEWVVANADSSTLAQTLEKLLDLPEEAYNNLQKGERVAVIEAQGLRALGEALARQLRA